MCEERKYNTAYGRGGRKNVIKREEYADLRCLSQYLILPSDPYRVLPEKKRKCVSLNLVPVSETMCSQLFLKKIFLELVLYDNSEGKKKEARRQCSNIKIAYDREESRALELFFSFYFSTMNQECHR